MLKKNKIIVTERTSNSVTEGQVIVLLTRESVPVLWYTINIKKSEFASPMVYHLKIVLHKQFPNFPLMWAWLYIAGQLSKDMFPTIIKTSCYITLWFPGCVTRTSLFWFLSFPDSSFLQYLYMLWNNIHNCMHYIIPNNSL